MILPYSHIAAGEGTPSEEAQGEKIVDALEQKIPEKKTVKFSPAQEKNIIHEIEKFNKFLNKSKLAPIVYTINPELKSQELEYQDEDGNTKKSLVYYKELTVKINPLKDLEWEVAGAKNPIASSEIGTGVEGNVIFLKNKWYEGPEVPKEIQTRSMKCEYCNTNHARSKTIILHNKKTGEFKEIGRSCLNFYLGNLNIDKFYKDLNAFLEEIVFKDHGSSRRISAIDLVHLIAATYYVVNKDGRYISQSFLMKNPRSDLQSTVSSASHYMFTSPNDVKEGADRQELIKGKEEIETLKPKAEGIIKWWRDNEATMEHNEFLDKMRSILKFNAINPKLMSFASYLVEIWRKAHGDENKSQDKEKVEKKPSEFQGAIGDRIERTLLVKRATSFNGQYGTTFVYSMEDPEGNEYVWFSSSPVLEDGKQYKLQAIVKDHKIWIDKANKEHKQTVITRAKIVELSTEKKVLVAVMKNYVFTSDSSETNPNDYSWSVNVVDSTPENKSFLLKEKERIHSDPPKAHTWGAKFPRQVIVGEIDFKDLFRIAKKSLSWAVKDRSLIQEAAGYPYPRNDITEKEAREIISTMTQIG